MSLFGSLFTGVSALTAQSQAMSVISNNIANVNTTGFKRGVNVFSSLVTQAGSSSVFSPGGVKAINQQTIDQQGLLQQTNSSTDVSVSGNGFFVVREEPTVTTGSVPLYTRAGSFSEDNLGLLRNSSGFYLQGWALDANGDIPANNADLSSMEPVDVSFVNGLTAPTTTIDLGANLQSDVVPATAPAWNFARAITIYDSQGLSHAADLSFRATGTTNEWTMEVDIPDAGFTNTSTITFDGSGALATIDGTAVATGGTKIPLSSIDWTDSISGAADSDISFDIASVTQFASDFTVAFVEQNGAELGLRTGVEINNEGYVIANFSNGQTLDLYKLPIATFNNPNGMSSKSGNVFAQSDSSGDFNLRQAGESGAGLVSPSSIEASNVDLADEFTRMIITQRAYSGGTKVITTADQMLTELLQIR